MYNLFSDQFTDLMGGDTDGSKLTFSLLSFMEVYVRAYVWFEGN
jgi:hypothetical protein